MDAALQPTAHATRIVIIGGVAGGASAAARARRANASARITLIEKGPAVSFANCGLPYHLGGEIASRGDLLVATPKLFRERFGVDVRTETEAIAIDREAKLVALRLSDGTLEQLPYDQLILSPGAEPIVPPFVRGHYRNVTSLWSLSDMDRAIAALGDRESARTVVVGGGFVGLEVAEQLVRRGHHCTLIERNNQVLQVIDPELAKELEDELRSAGVVLRLGQSVTRLKTADVGAEDAEAGENIDGDFVTAVEIGEESIPADLVVLAIGVRPRTKLAVDAGLDLGPSGGIRVDRWMRTSDPDILAVGDCVEYQHAVLGHPTLVPLAGPANRAGRIAGSVAAGQEVRPMGAVCGTHVVRVFSKTAAGTGLSESMCRAEGIECRSVYIQAHSHAAYFPGAESMLLKLTYSPQGKILGAQAVGGMGVDKRIDVIATAIHFGGSVADLAELDLAYAPPFGSAKDPVHMAAFVACNDLDAYPEVVPPQTVLDSFQVVDVRTSKELERMPLEGAIHAPIDALQEMLPKLDRERPTITVCHSGKRAHIAACFLRGSGFKEVRNLTGGMQVRSQWLAAIPDPTVLQGGAAEP